MRARYCAGAMAACLLLATDLQAQCLPDVVEDFTTFGEIDQDTFSSPTDTGQDWQAFPLGPTSTVGGFESSPEAYFGPGLTFGGDEEKAMIEDENISEQGPSPHQLAFAFRFTPTERPVARGAISGSPDITQLIAAVPADANINGTAYSCYMIAVGRLADTDPDTIFFFHPFDPNGAYWAEPLVVPKFPDQWHTMVIQYKPASNSVDARDAAVRIWVDPTSPDDQPVLDVPSSFNAIPSYWGTDNLARFAFGNSTDLSLVVSGPGARTFRIDRAGTSKVKVDRVGGWNGVSEGLRGSNPGPTLSDALCFLDVESHYTSWMLR